MTREDIPIVAQLAVKWHGDQMYGKHPYLLHLAEVYTLVHSVRPDDYDLLAAALLHDVLEDTDITEEDILEVCSEKCLMYVKAVTDEPGETRELRKSATYLRMYNSPREEDPAMLLKVADRLANCRRAKKDGKRSKLEMYRVENPTFQKAVHRPDQPVEWWGELFVLLTADFININR